MGKEVLEIEIIKHSACFISRYYKALTCRIVRQKVQRVPILMGAGEAIDVCLLTT